MVILKAASSPARLLLLGLLLSGLTACQPLGGSDPLDQDAFVTESAPVAQPRY